MRPLLRRSCVVRLARLGPSRGSCVLAGEDGPYQAAAGATPWAAGRHVWGPPFPGRRHQLRHITIHHRCMLRESQTLTQVFLQSTITHYHDSNITIFTSQSNHKESKLLIVINALNMKVFIISLLDVHHIRTKLIIKANYHVV